MAFKDLFNKIISRRADLLIAEETNEKRMQLVLQADNEWLEQRGNAIANLTDEQRQEIDRFWSKYTFAYKNNPFVQAHFSSVSGKFSPYYISYGLNTYYLYHYYDDPLYHTAFHDKNYREVIYNAPSTPVLVRRIKGLCFDKNRNNITFNSAVQIILRHLTTTAESVIVKPTPGGSGNGIVFINHDATIDHISETITSFVNDDIVIESIQKSHKSYAIANKTSLNTLRIVTHLSDGSISIIATVFRMGAEGNVVDNLASGGIVCGVNEDGTCFDFGFDRNGNVYKKHPNGFDFASHSLYNVQGARSFAKKLHLRTPQFKQVSWDIIIDENGEPMFVEMNPRGGLNLYQSIGALPFGDKTPEIIDDMLFTHFYKKCATKDWNFKEYTDHIVITKYCGNKKIVIVPEKINDKNVTQINNNCFKGNQIKSITIPGTVKEYTERICTDKNCKIIQLPDTRNINVPSPETANGSLALGRNIIEWQPIEGVTHYLVYRMENGKELRFLKQLSSYANRYVDNNIIDGKIYHYYIFGFNSEYCIKSENHAHVALKAWCTLNTPDLTLSKQIDNGVDLCWDKVIGATHYLIYRMKLGDKRTLLSQVNADTLTFSDKSLKVKGKYYYYVRAFNKNQSITSDWSNYKTIEF